MEEKIEQVLRLWAMDIREYMSQEKWVTDAKRALYPIIFSNQVEPPVSPMLADKWQKEKPNKPCLFVARYNKKDEHPDIYYAVYDDGILCVTDTYQNYNCTMEEFADCEFCIIEYI